MSGREYEMISGKRIEARPSYPINQINLLSNHEKLLLMEIISQCHYDSQNLMATLPEKLSQLIPYEMFAYGHGRVQDFRVYNHVNFNFPQNFVNSVVDNQILHCGLIKNWMQILRPLYFCSDSHPNTDQQSSWIRSLRENEINNIACHGMVDGTGTHASNFCFAQLFERWNARLSAILTILTPHLHHALIQPQQVVVSSPVPTNGFSTREHEVLHWLAQGKSNWETGIILGISESTVRIHVQKILEKLSARNRAHAVALALRQGVIGV